MLASFQSFIGHHPVDVVLLLGLTVAGFLGWKRLMRNHERRRLDQERARLRREFWGWG